MRLVLVGSGQPDTRIRWSLRILDDGPGALQARGGNLRRDLRSGGLVELGFAGESGGAPGGGGGVGEDGMAERGSEREAVDGALGFGGSGSFDGDELGAWAEGGFDLLESGGLDVGLEVLERRDEEMRDAVGAVEDESVEHGGIVGVAVSGDLREGRGDEDDLVAELAEAVGVGLHGEAGAEGELAFGVGEFGPIFGGERIREIVGGEKEAFAAGGEEEHVDVFDDATGERLEIGDGLAAGGFGEFGIDVESLVFVAGKERAGSEAAAVVEFEKVAAVEC